MRTGPDAAKPASRAAPPDRKPPPAGLTERSMLPSGEEFLCEAHGITPQGCEIAIKTILAPGTPVVCYFDNIGILRGTIREPRLRGFHLVFDMNETRRARVAARIEWYEARATETGEQRAAPRILPVNRDTEVRFGEHLVFKARIVDLSMSGVAVTVENRYQPFVGSLVRIGKRFATVARIIDGGFAAEFKLPFTRETVNQHVVL